MCRWFREHWNHENLNILKSPVFEKKQGCPVPHPDFTAQPQRQFRCHELDTMRPGQCCMDDKRSIWEEVHDSSRRSLMRSNVIFFFNRMGPKLSFFPMVTRIRSPSLSWIFPTGLRTLSS